MQKVAAIDCGTNSIRLLVAKKGESGSLIDCRERLVRINRLGFGVDKTGEFDSDALKRTFEFEKEFRKVLDEEGITTENMRFIATSAARDAKNRDIFFQTTHEILGIYPEIISGEIEADLSFSGVVSHQNSDQQKLKTLVVDLGGGSTELIVGQNGKKNAAFSMNIGSVRLTERFWGFDGVFSAETEKDAVDWINEVFDHGFSKIEKQGGNISQVEQIVGVAGTVTTLTAAALKLKEYDRAAVSGAVLKIEQVFEAADEILHSSKEQLKGMKFIHPGRVDVIQAGALIWKTLLQRMKKETSGRIVSTLTSEHDILDGIALSIISKSA